MAPAHHVFLRYPVGESACVSKVWFTLLDKFPLETPLIRTQFLSRNVLYIHGLKCANVNDYSDHAGHIYALKQGLGTESFTLDEIMLGLEMARFLAEGKTLHQRIYTKIEEMLQRG